jgi:hypothetical protein
VIVRRSARQRRPIRPVSRNPLGRGGSAPTQIGAITEEVDVREQLASCSSALAVLRSARQCHHIRMADSLCRHGAEPTVDQGIPRGPL